jgi:hypothetical protein
MSVETGNVIRFYIEYNFSNVKHWLLINECLKSLIRTKYPHVTCEICDVPWSIWHCRTEEECHSIFDDLEREFLHTVLREKESLN